MLLQRLAEYSRRQTAAAETALPALYAEGPARYFIHLDAAGRYLGMADTADPKNARAKRGVQRPLPQIKRSSGIKPLLLADKADYTLAYAKDGPPTKRSADCHAAYIALAQRCWRETEEPEVQAVLSFLESNPLEQIRSDQSFDPETFDPGAIITFQVEGRPVVDNPSVQTFWAAVNQPDTAAAQCLVCGQNRPPLKRLQSAIKGLGGIGGNPAGTDLISANDKAFESYGLEASLISPVCAPCATEFTRGLNDLLQREDSRIKIGNNISVFWTREPQEFDLCALFDHPEPQAVQALLESVYKGRWSDLDETAFYALSLSASNARAVVRDWLDLPVKSAKQNLALWFQRQRIAPMNAEENRYYGLTALALATVRERKDLPVTTPRLLLRSAGAGAPLPWSLLHQALRRCHAEGKVTRPKAALIKLALLSNMQPPGKEDYMVELDLNHPDPAYRCGVLLALLDQLQRAAIPGVAATVVDRFYATASTTPQVVFPRLLKGAQPHLAKLERDNRGAYYRLKEQMENIMAGIDPKDNFPKTLTLEQQGLFALGYYHRKAEDSRNIREAQQRRQSPQEMEETAAEAEDGRLL